MTYQETLDYLFSQLPIFQRQGKAAYKPDLSRTIAICDLLCNPQQKFPAVHIAGTNGKGSTSHMVASILQEAGYKTGLHTSPHLKDFRERIKINGEMISEQAVVEFVKKNKQPTPALPKGGREEKKEDITPSFFEYTVAMVFDYFAKQKVDIAVLETGMGGRLDSTNVCQPVVTAVTNIGMDHTQFLGDTLQKIATEKAGITKKGVPMVLGNVQSEIQEVFEQKAAELKTEIHYAEKQEYPTDLKGDHQQQNAALAVSIIQQLQKQGWDINEEDIKSGLQNVVKNTGLQGRWQTLSTIPFTICDCGHNVDGVKTILKELNKTNFNQLHFVLGMVGDKDIENILKLLPKNAIYYFCAPNIPRALPVEQLYEQATNHSLIGSSYPTVNAALIAAQQNATNEDLVFVGGSTFVVAEVV